MTEEKNIIGSMLKPFCFCRCRDKWWIMICGFQLLFNKKTRKIKFEIIPFRQWFFCKLKNRERVERFIREGV